MDRTNAIKRLNTEEIATEVNNVIKKGLDKLLGDYLYRYELLEQTHDAIMNLPSVRNHLNQSPLPPQQCENNNNNVKYEQMIEKLLKRIQELTFEVNQLKQTHRKECPDIKVEDELKVVKLEQKENIRLEIEDVASEADASEAEDDASEADDDDESSVSEASANEIEAEASEAEAEESSVASEAEENICSECDCKVILDEDIVVVDGKNYCGACDPTSTKEEDEVEEQEEAEEEEVKEEAEKAEVEDDVETEKSESDASEADQEEVEAIADEEEEEYIEIDIDDITYCTNNEENGFIYELTEDGDVGNKIGYLKDGEPFFYADEK